MEIIFPQNIFFYISAILTLVLFFVLLIAFFSGKKKNRIKKSLDSSLFLIRLPKYEKIKEGEKIDQKILIGKMEQIFANFLYLEDKSFSSVFFGNRPTAAMEVASEFGGSDISFYIAVPNYYALALPKYIQGAYPGAIVEKIANDYTIFEPEAIAATAYLRLKSSFYLPLKTYNDLDTDPLEAIANSLTNIKEDEGAAIQIIIRPPKTDYKKIGDEIIRHIINNGKDLLTAISEANKGILSGLVSSPTSKKNELGENQLKERRVDDATIEALRAKLKKPFFETNIRLVASAKNQNRANEILQNLESSFSQFFSSFNNLQVVRLKGNNARRLTYKYIFREFEERERLVLNSEELSSLYHLPLPHIESPYIKWAGTKEVEPSINLPISGPILLGKTMFRGEEKNVYIASEEDRRRHFYIVGQTGVGKSGFLSEMIRQDIESGHGVGVIDPHGELVEDILTLVPEERVGDVVLFEPFQTERPCGLNMLEWETPEQKDLAVSEMVAIFYKLFPPEMIGPMFEHYMRNAMLAIMADKDNPGTLIEIPRIFTDDKFMEAKLQKVSDPLVRSFWLKEWKQTTGSTKSDMLGYVISKIGRFIENEMLRNIVGQPRSGFNLSEIMDNKKIFLANLSKGQTGELNSSLLGLILVSKMQMAAMKRASMPSELRKDFYLYLDEFQNFATDSIATILSEARKYRLDLILAHQYMPQLTDTIKNAVIGNVGTFASFRIGADDAEFLEKQFSPQFSKFDLLNLDNFQLILKMMINNKLATPFKIKTLLPQKGNPEISLAIKELSKIRYGRPKSMVEADIMTTLNL
ncbi:MAG: DUF87 domain-containing protein [Candidatus Paceibacterota bacterium]|jgi:hypothetical protein